MATSRKSEGAPSSERRIDAGWLLERSGRPEVVEELAAWLPLRRPAKTGGVFQESRREDA